MLGRTLRATLAALLGAGAFVALALPAAAATIDFSGYTWTVKNGTGMGPGPNSWSNSSRSVYVDRLGRLHLKVRKINGVWNSSEVYLSSSLGYGRYDWTVDSRVDLEDPVLVAALFLYQDDTHEFDIEHSRWKARYSTNNSSFNIQPSGGSNSDVFNFRLSNASSQQTLFWSATSVTLTIIQNGVLKRQWIYTGANNFTPGSEVVHMSHWMFQGTNPQDKRRDHDLIIRSFTYTP